MFVMNDTWRTRFAWLTSTAFTWLCVGPPAGAACAHPSRTLTGHRRTLTPVELRHIRGAQGPLALPGGILPDNPADEPNAGGTYPWEGSVGDLNTLTGNKLTTLPLLGWTARGGLPVNLTLYHNSEATTQSELGFHWTHSFAIYAMVTPGTGNFTVQWGDNLEYTFQRNIDGSFTAPEGIFDSLSYNPTTQKYTLVRKDHLRYTFCQPNGTRWNCTSIQDRNSNTLTINHNASDFVSSVVDPSGRTLTFQYSGALLTGVTDPLGRTFGFSQAGGNLTGIQFPSVGGQVPQLSLAYNGEHNITSVTDLRGKVWTFGYTPNGRALAWAKNPLGQETDYFYAPGQTRVVDPLGRETRHTYANGLLLSTQDPTLATVQYGYTGALRTSITDAAGNAVQFVYDSNGNVLSITDALGSTTSFQYNPKNDPIRIARPTGRLTSFTYDAAGNLTAVTNPLGQTAQRTVNSNGLVTASTDPLGRTCSFAYDTHGNCISSTDALSHSSSYVYDLLGRRVSATNPVGQSVSISYDPLGRVMSLTALGNRTSAFTYDLSGLRLSQTNPLGQTDTFGYDDAGRLTRHTDTLGRVVTFGYDAVGNRTRFTDGRGKSTYYAFDSRNQLSQVTYPDGTSQSLTYDLRGLPASRTDGRGIQSSNSYDALGRLTGITYSDSTPSVSVAFNGDGQKIGMTDGTGTTSYTYDAAGRLTARATPQGAVNFAYDAAGQLVTRVAAGTAQTYAYDAGGRMTSVNVGGNQTTSYTYDDLNRLVNTAFPNGTVETRSYSTAGELASLATTKGMATITSQSYTYDSLGRKLSETSPSASQSYSYDAAGQLTSEQRTGTSAFTALYTYDSAGNRLTRNLNGTVESYTYDNANKLLSAGGKTFSYDAAGNTIAATNAGSTTTLTWDAESRLKSSASATGTVLYGYNGLSQRVSKSGATSASYLLADDTIDAEILQDGAARYAYGAMGLFSESRGGNDKFYHLDALGSTRALTNPLGEMVDTRSTDAFGIAVASSGSTSTPFGYAGNFSYQKDMETGLMRVGHRLYDSATGRFISRDPIQDGYNWYGYCDNDPVNWADPAGLKPQTFDVTYTGSVGGITTGSMTFIGLDGKPIWSCPIDSGGHGAICPIGKFPVGTPRPSTKPNATGGVFTPVGRVPDRINIGIHFDGNTPGTEGCIGIEDWGDYLHFIGIMNGLGNISTGNYRPPVDHLVSIVLNPSLIFSDLDDFLNGLNDGLIGGGNKKRPIPVTLKVGVSKK